MGRKVEPTKKLLALALHYWKALAVAFGAVTFLSTMGPMIDWIRDLSAVGIERDGTHVVLGRKIVYTYRWPGMSQKLLRRGSETFNLTTRSQGTLQKVEYCLYFDTALHRSRDLGCEVIGMKLPGASLKVATSDAGWKGWRYEATDVPAGSDFDCQIEVRAKR